MEGFSDTLLGFRVRFMEGMLTGTFSSSFKATSHYKHNIENLLMLSFISSVDFQKSDKPAQFGVSLSLGGMWACQRKLLIKVYCNSQTITNLYTSII